MNGRPTKVIDLVSETKSELITRGLSSHHIWVITYYGQVTYEGYYSSSTYHPAYNPATDSPPGYRTTISIRITALQYPHHERPDNRPFKLKIFELSTQWRGGGETMPCVFEEDCYDLFHSIREAHHWLQRHHWAYSEPRWQINYDGKRYTN